MEERIERLIQFCYGIANQENGGQLYEKYLDDINTVTPRDVMLIQDTQLKQGVSNDMMTGYVDKLINVFYKPLSTYQWERPETDSFLGVLMDENESLKQILEAFKKTIIGGRYLEHKDELSGFVNEVSLYEEHLLKLENILFPYLEKKDDRYLGLKVLWSLHDQTREVWKLIGSQMDLDFDEQKMNEIIGDLYFKLFGLIQKQELILFPCAVLELSDEDMNEMERQSHDYGFPYRKAPKTVEIHEKSNLWYDLGSKIFQTDTGHFDLVQLDAMLGALPLDITLVDENDKVAYFSRPKERLFPRSAAVIGRDVRNCHPAESVHIVEKILEAFKTGEKDSAEFWIQMKGKFIYIQYIAILDEERNYRGTLEMTQDITLLRALRGEQRLLNWEESIEGSES